jgi:Xaa-Pro aminopeptidase
MDNITPKNELDNRLNNLIKLMDKANSNWEFIIIVSKINIFYFTGTMQEGLLIIERNKIPVFWVKKSYERAKEESLFPNIKKIISYRGLNNLYYNKTLDSVYLETEKITLSYFKKLNKIFSFKEYKSIDYHINSLRAVKSDYELDKLKTAGKIHEKVLEKRIPEILREGMSELELATELFTIMIEEGHHGVSRFSMFDTEMGIGHIAFGESSLYPTYFNGPGGNYGMNPAVPLFGSRERKLKNGDLVFIDIGLGFDGYHTDKTMTYIFGKDITNEAKIAHYKCVEIQDKLSSLLIPGAIPEKIFQEIISNLDNKFLENFMGYKNNTVKFLGHGTGLYIDEMPVIAESFKETITKNMVFALEPKKGIKNIGLVGIENTFLVTDNSGISITGKSKGLIKI